MLHALLIVTTLLSSPVSLSSLIMDPSNITDNNAISVDKSLPSVSFPLIGDIYQDKGYYVLMEIGDPQKPYFLDVDTGSDLTWIQCAPCKKCWKGPHPYYKPRKAAQVKCRDATCSWVTLKPPHIRDCDKTPERCDYEYQYADGLKTYGKLVSDVFTLKLYNNNVKVRQDLALGCGYDQTGKDEPHVDGILGLGRGKASIVSQLSSKSVIKNIFGHCLSRNNAGYLFLGDKFVPTSGVIWASMASIQSGSYYSVEQRPSFYYGRKYVDIKKPAPVVFDSGASFIYFADELYQTFLEQLVNDLKHKNLKLVKDQDKSDMVCWKGEKQFKSFDDVKKLFKILVLRFGRSVQYEIPPENYLIITGHGNACLGIFDGSKHGIPDLNLIGDIAMLDMMVIYDNEKQRIGWTKMTCDKQP